MNIFSKFNSNEYNNELEQILENKEFDETVKNLLLNMLYKLESGYRDYEKVKPNAVSKEQFMQKILYIVKEECEKIQIVTPKTQESKPLEQSNSISKIDADKGSILVYANEKDLLYSLIKMDESKKFINRNKDEKDSYYGKAIKEFLITSRCINDTETIRDFDGWSWNSGLKEQKDIECNLIFQIMLLLNINLNKIIINYEQNLENEDNFYKQLYINILTIIANNNIETKNEINKELSKKKNMLEIMNDKKKLLNKITQDKKQITNEIKQIDELLNNKEELKREYTKRNSKLENKDKIFSVSHLSDILEKEREEKLEELRSKNKLLEPLEYIKRKSILENEVEILQQVEKNLEDNKQKNNSIINLQVEFLKCFEKQIEKIEERIELEKILYEFRYYCLLPIFENKNIKDIKKLEEYIKNVMNVIIDNCIYKQIITNYSNSISLCYNILKYIFTSKIIDLNEVSIKIINTKKEKTEEGINYYITIKIYDDKDAEETYSEVVNNLNLLNVKLNKKIPFYIKNRTNFK